MNTNPKYCSVFSISVCLLTMPAHAGNVPTDYDWQWSTIGDVGNRATIDGEIQFQSGVHIGSVGYEYRMATTEVTVGQWLEFVSAYTPFYYKNTGHQFTHPNFTGNFISVDGNHAFIEGDASANQATNMSWEYAARYVNWLHNDKVIEDWAFETGAYDTSTFTENPDGSYNHQAIHNPDADFWIPTRDEWTKAAYWDPNKNSGDGGYWLFPNSTDEESIPGLERNAGSNSLFPLDVGSFPDVASPWGIFDLAGGVNEWNETAVNGDLHLRFTGGSPWQDIAYGEIIATDMIGWGGSTSLSSAFPGLRLASATPTPNAISLFIATGLLLSRRNR